MGSVGCRCCAASDDNNQDGASKEIQVCCEKTELSGPSIVQSPSRLHDFDIPAAASLGLETAPKADAAPPLNPASPGPVKATHQGLRLPEDVLRARESGDEESPSEKATRLLKGLRTCEAATILEGSPESALRADLEMQLTTLGDALETLGNHPGLNSMVDEIGVQPEVLLGINVPNSPQSARSRAISGASEQSGRSLSSRSKRDVLEVNFELDDEGRRVEAVVEFFADGSASLMWTAFDLPVPMPYVLCMVHEVDLLGDIAPYVKDAGVLHQFSSNEADRLVRVISQPPIPMVAGLEAVAQRFGYDLLDTPWEAFCLVEVGPTWTPPPSSSTSSGAVKTAKGSPPAADQWRGVSKPLPFQKGLKQVDVKKVVALGRPVGPDGDHTTILFSGKGDLKVSRSLLPNWLISWLVKLVGKFIYQRALDRVAKFESSSHGDRLRASDFYPQLFQRIEEHIAAKAQRASAPTEEPAPP